MRIHNLSLLLSLVHRTVLISRSDLANQTGLNRSTISDLITELTELGLLEEIDKPQASGVGRPSHLVTVTSRVVAIAVEISNYAVRVAALGLSRQRHRAAPTSHRAHANTRTGRHDSF
jgi:predicted ArsR family transcriptional regulator